MVSLEILHFIYTYTYFLVNDFFCEKYLPPPNLIEFNAPSVEWQKLARFKILNSSSVSTNKYGYVVIDAKDHVR